MPRVPYFRSYLLLSRRRWVLAMLAAIAGAVLLATFVPFATDSAYNYSVDRYYETYSFLLHQGGAISDAEHRQARRLESIIEEANPAEYCRKVRSYELRGIKEQKSQGRSSDPDARRLYSFTTTFLNAVCKLSSPALYQGTDDMPGLVLVAYYLGVMPSPVLLLAPFALLWVIARENASSRLLSHAPLSPAGMWLYLGCLGALLALIFSLVPMLPAFVLSVIRNGVGDLAYPIIYWQDDVLVRTTLGRELMRYAGFFLIAGFCLGTLCHLATSLRAPAVMAAGIALLVPPCLDDYYDLGAIFPDALASLPSTYFSADRLLGRLGGIGAQNAIPMAGANATRGVLSIAVLIALMGLAGVLARSAALARSYGRARKAAPEQAIPRGRLLVARDVSVGYVRNQPLVTGALSLASGGVVGFVAPNGYGKTTLLAALAGVPQRPRATSVDAMAVSAAGDGCVSPRSQAAWRRSVFLLPGDGSVLYDHLTPDQTIELVSCLWRCVPERDTLADMAAGSFRRKRIATLSQGMRQQAAIAVALATQAPVLLLDEPMNALDPTNRQLANERVRAYAEEGRCVFMSSHLLNDLDEVCDGAYLIRDGALVDAGGRHRPPLPALYWEFYPRPQQA